MGKNLSCTSKVAISKGRSVFTFSVAASEILCVAFSLLGGRLVVPSDSHLIHQLKEFDSRVVQVGGSSELNSEGGLKTG